MQDVDIKEVFRFIPTRHLVVGMLGGLPLGAGLMGWFAPPADGGLAWLGEYAGPLIVLGAVMGMPLFWSSARAGLAIRRRLEREPRE